MEKEIVKKLQQIEAEQQRRKNTKLAKYNSGSKVHLKQMEFHKCQKRNRWVFGGNRSGKTECGAVEAVWWARGIHPYRQNRDNVFGWIVSLTKQVQRDVAQKKVLEYLDKHCIADVVMADGRKDSLQSGIIDHIIVKNSFGGKSIIGFKSCDQGREKFQGTSLDFVWFDEEPPQDIYQECRMRLLDKKGEMWATMTPLKGMTFVYDLYLNAENDDEVWTTFMEWADNPYLPADEVTRLNTTMSADELESRRYGRFSCNGGLVYGEFDVNTHVIEPFDVPPEWYDAISIDPGLNNPLSAHFYAIDYDGNIYVIAEHYQSQKDINYHAQKIKEIAARLNWHTDSGGRIEAYIDPAANQRTLASARSVSELFFEQGIKVNTQVKKDLFSGISRVKGYLKSADGQARLFVFKNCVNLIREFKGYYWGDSDVPIKKDDHALDELRYYISTKPEPHKPSTQKTLIQKDKERLYKKLKFK